MAVKKKAHNPAKNSFEAKLNILKGDNVVIIIGKDKGKTGKVTRVFPKQGKIVVEGLNIVTKHVRSQPTPTDPNPQGGRIEVEAPILASKVMLVNNEGKPTRVRVGTDEQGKKVRIAVNGGLPIPAPSA